MNVRLPSNTQLTWTSHNDITKQGNTLLTQYRQNFKNIYLSSFSLHKGLKEIIFQKDSHRDFIKPRRSHILKKSSVPTVVPMTQTVNAKSTVHNTFELVSAEWQHKYVAIHGGVTLKNTKIKPHATTAKLTGARTQKDQRKVEVGTFSPI